MFIREIILPQDPRDLIQVLMTDYSFFFVPNGYTETQIYQMVSDHNNNKRSISFYQPTHSRTSNEF